MTDQEILEAEKLIAGIRNDLTVLASTTDAEKLMALVLEKVERMMGSFNGLVIRHRPTVFVSVEDRSWLYNCSV